MTRRVIGALGAAALLTACAPAGPSPHDLAARAATTATSTPTAPTDSTAPGASSAASTSTPVRSPSTLPVVSAVSADDLVPTAEVLAAVAAARSVVELPADLQPALSDGSTDYEDLKVTGCAKEVRRPEAGECVYGDVNGSRLLVLLGDSHAGMWLTAIHLVALDAGWQVRMLSKAGCPSVLLDFWDRTNQRPHTDCTEYHDWAVARIDELEPDAVVITNASIGQPVTRNDNATAADWSTGLASLLDRLSAPGRRLIVLGDVPVLPAPNPDCLAANRDDIRRCGSDRDTALLGVLVEAERTAAIEADAAYVSTVNWFCTDWCGPVIADRQVFRNQYHVTATYSRYLAGALAASLRLGA
ncbi:MAG: SGNH hydrolase domain-containing protein [Ilumatobacteraceae bacterium]